MANLSSFSTLHDKVKKYHADFGLRNLSSGFAYLALESILNLTEDEIEDADTEGDQDGGMDAIHISGTDVHIFNFKYAETFDNSTKNFPEGEVDKILVTMNAIMIKSLKREQANEFLWDKVQEIWDLFDESGPINFKFHFASNKEKLVERARKKLESNLGKYKFVEFNYYDQDDLVSRIIEKKSKRVDGELRFVDTQYFERSDGPLKGIVATVPASDLMDLVRDPENPERIQEDAFNENVRVYLKLKNRINQSIHDTALSDSNFEFWYLNNGITILCDECVYAPNTRSPKAKLKNLQIVNGGQTTHALFEASLGHREKLEKILVLVRICQTNDRSISEKISETTNSQTPIRSRDLHANERVQRKLEEQFKTLGYCYERKKNQHSGSPRAKRLSNELLGQICLAYYLDMPAEAKNKKTIVFSEKYDEIFDEDTTTAERMLLAYKLYLPLDAKKKTIKKKIRNKEAVPDNEAF